MHDIYQRLTTSFFLILLVIATLFFMPSWGFALLMLIFLGIILVTEWPRLLDYKKTTFWLLMPLYPILPFGLVITMQLTGYEVLNVLMIVIVALYDTGSYLIGNIWGKHKISILISPGKTWEGYIGGTLLTTLATFLYFQKNAPTAMILPIIPITIGICLCALLGDLFESFLKRKAGIKDSGTLLPGHGGLLDRIDGMMLVSLIVYVFKDYLKCLLTHIS